MYVKTFILVHMVEPAGTFLGASAVKKATQLSHTHTHTLANMTSRCTTTTTTKQPVSLRSIMEEQEQEKQQRDRASLADIRAAQAAEAKLEEESADFVWRSTQVWKALVYDLYEERRIEQEHKERRAKDADRRERTDGMMC